MKLLFISTGYTPVLPSSKRSVETSIYLLTKEVAKLGHNTTVVDIKTHHYGKNTKANFYEVWTIPLKGSNMLSYFLKVIAFTLQLPLVLLRHKDTDVIQTYSQFPTIILAVTKRLFRIKAPIYYLTCSPYLAMPPSLANTLKHTPAEKWALKLADRLLVHTNTISEILTKRFKIEPKKIIQVFAGVDIESIQALDNMPRVKELIFYPAVITSRKNQLMIIKALPEVLKVYPETEVILTGLIEDQSYYNEIQEFITKYGLSNITFTGFLTKLEVHKLYQKATVMVFPTLFEMQGIVLVEAMAFGLPVIASKIKVIEDIVNLEKDCAILINPNSSKSIGKAIIKVFSNEDLRNQLSNTGRKLAYSRFSWNKIAEELVKEYEKLCK